MQFKIINLENNIMAHIAIAQNTILLHTNIDNPLENDNIQKEINSIMSINDIDEAQILFSDVASVYKNVTLRMENSHE